MMRLLHEFLAFYRARARSPVKAWLPGDAQALALFFKTDAGRRLFNNMCLESVEQDRQATIGATPYMCGVAVGFRLAIAILQTFSEVLPTEDKKPQNAAERAAALRERISP